MRKIFICHTCGEFWKNKESHKATCCGDNHEYISMNDIFDYIENVIDRIEVNYPNSEPLNEIDGIVYAEFRDLEKEIIK